MKKIETLVVAGCSHSFGAETVSEDKPVHPDSIKNAYGKFIADRLYCKYVNISYSGISNFEIARKVQQYVDFNAVDPETTLIIIGWTDPNRFTFYPRKILRYLEGFFIGNEFPYNFSAYSIDFSKAYDRVKQVLDYIREIKFGEEFLSFFRNNIFETSYFYDLNYMQRLLISNYLECKKIRHLTFSTLKEKPYKNTVKYEKLLATKYNILENKDKFNFYDAFRQYGVHKGGHLTRAAHIKCSEFLFTELKKRGII